MYRLFFLYMSIPSVIDRSNEVNGNSDGKKKRERKNESYHSKYEI